MQLHVGLGKVRELDEIAYGDSIEEGINSDNRQKFSDQVNDFSKTKQNMKRTNNLIQCPKHKLTCSVFQTHSTLVKRAGN